MIAKEVIINKVVEYVNNQLGTMSANNPVSYTHLTLPTTPYV